MGSTLIKKEPMEATEQIAKFAEFIELNYKPNLLEALRKGDRVLEVDFSLLTKFSPELAEAILDDPDEVIRAGEKAIENIEPGEKSLNFRLRFKNLPLSQNIFIREIRAKNLGKFLYTKGVVRQKSEVRPQATSAKFECPACGVILNVLQVDSKFREPMKCNGCGRKGKFRLLGKELADVQKLVLEEAPEDLSGGEQPQRISVFLKNDLVSPLGDRKTNPGSKIIVVGQVKEVPIILRTGGQSIRFDIMVEANNVQSVEEDYTDIKISESEEEEIVKLSKEPDVYEKIVRSIAPSIYGLDKIKEALIFQLMGGVQKKRDDGVVTRGDMHILLIGDPGSGKSQLLKRMAIVAPKARYVSGKGASGAGLTASVVKDEFLRGWSLEAGALVLGNKGFCMIDELDKMSKDDTSAMHEALEQQTVTISKANIQATLRSETTVLAAANPKFGRFDPYAMIAEQIELPITLINRFDLIFPVKDLPDMEKDTKMAEFILNMHQNQKVKEVEISTALLRKYIAYARQKIHPKLTDAALEALKVYYVNMRKLGISDDGGIKAIPISARQLEGLIRLSEASAKIRLSAKVTRKDADRAIALLDYCMQQVGIDKETGQVDIDRIVTGIPSSERAKIVGVREIIEELEGKLGKTIPIEDIIALAREKGLDEGKVEESIEKLKRSGDLFEPRRGFISRI